MAPKTLIWDCELKPNVVSAWTLYKPTVAINQIIEPAGIICFAWRWHGEKRTRFCGEWESGGYSGMVRTLHELFDAADVVCGYNSNNFDNRWANSAFLMEGLAPPSPYKQVDLYREVRKNFNLPSRKLDYVARQLGLGGKVSHSGMGLWNAVVRGEGEAQERARKLMRRYCIQDVDLASDLYVELLPWLSPGVSAGLFVNEESPVCSNCGSDNLQRRGWAYTTYLRYRRWQCQACSRWLRSSRSEGAAQLR